MDKTKCGNCCCSLSCCDREINKWEKRRVVVDFLYLDLSTCQWCQGTEKNLEEAIKSISNVLDLADIEIILNKVNVNTEELAIKYKFVSSPTIRVNGRDIQMEVREKKCNSCGDLCGDEVNCRVWIYKNEEYTIPPKELIVEGLLKEIFGHDKRVENNKEYVMPENLKKFYAAMEQKNKYVNPVKNNHCKC